jgi:dUTP pyrophosphatase
LTDSQLSCNDVKLEQEDIIIPKRATKGSAGYDFYLPYDISIKAKESITVDTGIRCKIEDSYVLSLYPRSSLGFKYGLQLRNTVGIIDSDYYNADNYGHIKAKLINTSNEDITLEKGKAFMQGIFTKYYLAEEEEIKEERKGGFGSTNK